MDEIITTPTISTPALHPAPLPPAERDGGGQAQREWALPSSQIDGSQNNKDAQREDFLAQAALLNLMGQTPISFHRLYVDITGNVITGLWLSSVLERVAQAKPEDFQDDDYVFRLSATQCHQVTGITASQQRTCRRDLIALGMLSEQSGPGRVPEYRLHLNVVADAILQASASLANSLKEVHQQQGLSSSQPVLSKRYG
ncbi:hypothetical protein LNA76_04355 [Alcaligenes sp. MMA]|uniref:hypothetical protein n=1 Tax=Alcaligenes sp. MMA TaxID=2893019 RepID=UPI001E47B4BF|nr:hypothetical protein [Alcaligenes sp. MMA]MCC9162552.1 hypothetical protein [Alcaligenes sp. MMA]